MASPPVRMDDSPASRWLPVIVLALVAVLNQVDRFLPAILTELIKADLQLSDTALGLINGLGFLLIYALMGIPIARLADRGGYAAVVSGCLAVWSAMTMLGGLAQNGWHLALSRMGVAAGEAGSSPASHAYISRQFAPARRAAPLALLAMASPIAYMISVGAGGVLGQSLGWRSTFLIIGLVGLLLAPLALLALRQGGGAAGPVERVADGAARLTSFGALFRTRSYRVILAATGGIGMAGYCLTIFTPAFLIRSHGMSARQVGLEYAPLHGLIGIAVLVIVGQLADRLAIRDPRWSLWTVAGLAALFAPCAAGAFLVQDRAIAMVLLALANSVTFSYQAPIIASIQRVTPVDLRASASAVMLFFIAIAGGIGPALVGAISDALHPRIGPHSLGRAMLIVPVLFAVSALLYLVASRSFRKDLVE